MDDNNASTSANVSTSLHQTPNSRISPVPIIAPSANTAILSNGNSVNNNACSTNETSSAVAAANAAAMNLSQDLVIKTRKLQLEIEEKNEIINILKDELETLREQSDKYQKENLKLIKDAKKVSFLQDENDFLQDKVGSVEKLEHEIKRLKEKLNELDFLKIRVTELEEDRNKAQDEANRAEALKREAESKLGRISELEGELEKWKSFSQELEQTRDSLQRKLLESIESETKLNADNKKVEDEVKRLRDFIKNYEEQRDEEQASTSLKSVGNEVMFAVNQELVDENESLKEELRKKEVNIKEISDELNGNRKLISELRQDLACEKNVAQKLNKQIAQFTRQIKSLDKQYFPIHDNTNSQQHPLMTSNNEALPTATKSTSEEPSHIPESANDYANVSNRSDRHQPKSSKNDQSNDAAIKTTSDTKSEAINSTVSAIVKKSESTADEVPKQTLELNLSTNSSNHADAVSQTTSTKGVQKQSTKPATSDTAKMISEHDEDEQELERPASNFVRNSLSSRSVNFGHSKTSSAFLDRIRASVSATTKTNTITTSYNEQTLRNSLVVASTNSPANTSTENTSANEKLDYLCQTNALTSPSNINSRASSTSQESTRQVLNCMLNHKHSERCFVSASSSIAPAQVQVYKGGQKLPLGDPMIPVPSYNYAHTHMYEQNQNASSHQHPSHSHMHPFTQHYQTPEQIHLNGTNSNGMPSRQLNALIDPVANEQLFGMLQQQHSHQAVNCHTNINHHQATAQLTEQQLKQWNYLQRQHYIHHLHELYQLHHQHHMHLHHQHQHKCSRQQSSQTPPRPSRTQLEKVTIGSQFQAPASECHENHSHQHQHQQQVYSDLTVKPNCDHLNLTNNNDQQSSRLRQFAVVNDSQANLEVNNRNNQQQLRKSPPRLLNGTNANLPQIDETAPTAGSIYYLGPQEGKTLQGSGQRLILGTASPPNMLRARLRNQLSPQQSANHTDTMPPTNGLSPISSSASSSPTSSSRASSNSSPSSASSLDSLSASGQLKLNRSAASRYSASDLNRRQYSVERELVGQPPMTAKLSRVGSCRGFPVQHQQHEPSANQQHHMHQMTTSVVPMNGLPSPQMLESSSQQHQNQLRNPAKAQQPSMKTSKILNISGGQQQQHQQFTLSNSMNHQLSGVEHQHTSSTNDNSKPTTRLSAAANESANNYAPASGAAGRYKQLNQLANNLAEIKLNDSLAFSSLRAPKKSSSGSNLILNKSLDNHQQRRLVKDVSPTASLKLQGNTAAIPKASLKDKQHQQQRPRSGTSFQHASHQQRGNNDGNNNNTGNNQAASLKKPPNDQAANSSVWFEYGCV